MRDILLFTKERLPTEKSIQILTDSIKNGKRNGENGFMIEKPSSLFLEFQNEPISDAPDFDFSDEEKKKICAFFAANDCFINHIEYHRSLDVRRVLEALLSFVPAIYLFVDEEGENGGYCTAEEYLNKKFEY